MRINIFLKCTKCEKRHQNYRTSRSKELKGNNSSITLSINKHCKFCKKKTLHKEEIIK